jgi:acetyl esterase
VALPGALARLRPVVIDGQTLDPEIQWLLLAERLGRRPALEGGSARRARRLSDIDRRVMALDPTPPCEVSEGTLPGAVGPLPVRIYRAGAPPEGAGALVYFHGGGFVIGDLETHDDACRLLAAGSGAVVIAVDYRLAPEAPFPAPVEDAAAAWRGAAARAAEWGLDPTRMAIGGDSAGGNLAAVVSQITREDPVRPCLQLLIYPAVNRTWRGGSRELFTEGFLLTEGMVRWFMDLYMGGHDPADLRVSPALNPDLAGLPPAHIVTCGFDMLRDEGEDYARRLEAAGVPVTLHREASLPHGFLQTLGGSAACRAATRAIAERLVEALARKEAAV